VIRTFVPQTRYGLSLNLEADGIPFRAELVRVKGYDLPFASREFPDRAAGLLQNAVVWVRRQARREQTHNPPAPFTTAALQQAAATRLGFTPERTMQLAQTLYETGRITYHRTDGLTVAPEAQTAARALIQRDYGDAYLPPEAPQHRVRTLNAQEAHEAIRPVDVNDLPRDSDGDAARLYALIWKRFIASQMQAARFTLIGAQIAAGRSQDNHYPLEFRARGRTLAFDGYRRVDAGDDQDVEMPVPAFTDGQTLTNHGAQVDEIVSRAPARYSEATLIEALERHGIGRPSTYASTLKTLKHKGYVALDGQQLVPTTGGEALCEYLTAHFPDLFTADYTARLEEQLDRVAAGEVARDGVLDAFWGDFQPALAAASGGHASRPVPLRPLED
jgi:DNA topoisomerase-1